MSIITTNQPTTPQPKNIILLTQQSYFLGRFFLFAEEADTGEGILGAGEAASTGYLVRLIVCMSV